MPSKFETELNMAPTNGLRPGDDIGFWGSPSSTINWCETNYEMTYYVAEFWNTVTNLGMIVFEINLTILDFVSMKRLGTLVMPQIHKGLICTKQKSSQRKPRELNMCFASLRAGYVHGDLELRIIIALQIRNTEYFVHAKHII